MDLKYINDFKFIIYINTINYYYIYNLYKYIPIFFNNYHQIIPNPQLFHLILKCHRSCLLSCPLLLHFPNS